MVVFLWPCFSPALTFFDVFSSLTISLSPTLRLDKDGAKCDIMRLQQMFGPNVVTAVQDPSYPVYVDTSVMLGQTKGDRINPTTNQYDTIIYMPCTPENDFFPDYANFPRADIVFICSPNNPIGTVATYDQLKKLVDTCIARKSILVYDAAYAPFIRSPNIPKSIFEVEGAKQVAIEVNSFSKYAGFTGVRLGWVVCPKQSLLFDDGTPVWNDLNRVMGTTFNGASNIVQEGGMNCLDEAGLREIDTLIDYYLENAQIIKRTMEELGFTVYGGVDAPYVFVALPKSMGGSWQAFQTILETCQVVTIPGAGFGPGGEDYLRLSAFAPRAGVEEACRRLTATFANKVVEAA
jgi:LL-diaminopimelate aminotransferase